MPRNTTKAVPPAEKAKIKALFIHHVTNGETVSRVCKMKAVNLARITYYQWMDEDPEFMAAMEQARERGAHAIADDILDIADYSSNDWIETEKGKMLDTEAVLRAKLRCDVREKLLAKWHPKKYGTKVEDEDPANKLPTKIQVEVVQPKPVD